eukprot:TRINITY_DN4863_c0_g1_i2.p1 TRINITY_DN4863_c0_g1~~TRINITY_DN4863_c0_g1_i2.p1  ORF type:complete len:358 (-),score=105.68 TRINITY_DN4863_c0_g1_i2:398-1471(-)
MKNFFITLALIALTQVRHGDAWANCTLENRQNCLSCMDLGANCGWCAATQQCINGTKAGPSDGSLCLGGAWQYGGAGSCVQCSSLGSCNQCTQHNADCIWCLNRQNVSSCKPIGFSGCVAASSQCACHKYGTCSECIGSSQCQWCPTSGECLELTNSSCPGGAQELTCPCTEYANCFECRTDDSCAWCSDIGGCANKTNLGGCLVAHNCNEYCQQGTDCLGCEQLNGCSWCQNYNDTQCIDTTTQIVTDCIAAHSCQDPQLCQYFTDCSMCNHVDGCGWCDQTNSCSDASDGKCAYRHYCSPSPSPSGSNSGDSPRGFDAASFVGGMFLIVGIVVIGVAIYAFYRWRVARRTYTELK